MRGVWRSVDDTDLPLKILGVDNGTRYLGIALIEFDLVTQVTTVKDAFTVTAREELYHYGSSVSAVGRARARFTELIAELSDTVDDFMPHLLAVETPFVHKNPYTYGTLKEMIGRIADLVEDNRSTGLRLVEVAPTEAKLAVGSATTDKEDVRKAVLASPNILFENRDGRDIQEDAMDAIAVAVCAAMQVVTLRDW
jgi:Holliday junction resolvasome RuvABC endonuclease subunit